MKESDDEMLKRMAKEDLIYFAHSHQLSPAWAEKAYEKLINAGWADSLEFLKESAKAVSSEQLVQILKKEDLERLRHRHFIIRNLFSRDSLYFTLAELAAEILTFLEYCKCNKWQLIRTGYPKRSYQGAKYFERNFGRLYYVKLSLIQPGYAIEQSGAATDLDQWCKEQAPMEAGDSEDDDLLIGFIWEGDKVKTWYGQLITPCIYEEAAFLPGLDPEIAARAETLRRRLFEIQFDCLRRSQQALIKRDATNMLEETIEQFSKVFNHEEMSLLNVLDNYYPRMRYKHGHMDSPIAFRFWNHWHEGMISRLLNFMAHVDCEIAIGVYHHTKERISQFSISQYLDAYGKSWRAKLDDALDKYQVLKDQEAEFRQSYFTEKARHAFEDHFYIDLHYPLGCKAPIKYAQELEHFIDTRIRPQTISSNTLEKIANSAAVNNKAEGGLEYGKWEF